MFQEQKYILALNVGSTSIKSRVFMFSGGKEKEVFSWSKGNINPLGGHTKALNELKQSLIGQSLLNKVGGVGHRVVHGGSLKKTTQLGKKELSIIDKYSRLAPLHNPYNLKGIKESMKWFRRKIPQVAVFDTAFFSSIPNYASTYAIPDSLTKKYGLYRYGFHGISHQFALLSAAKLLKKPVNKINLITAHLGGGASITAISKGKAVDTSMGFTPLEGLVMGTRSGDIDPGIIFFLAKNAKMSLGQLEDVLVKKSGIRGVSGAKNMLDLLIKLHKKDKKADLALKIYVYRLQKYIGAYLAILGRCEGIVFTGAIGSGDRFIRGKIVNPLKPNILKKIPVLAIPSNEEKMIAREAWNLLNLESRI